MFKKYREFCVFSKIIYFFMNTYFVPFKVIPTRYYTLFPILEALQNIIFCDLVQLLLRCRLYIRIGMIELCFARHNHQFLWSKVVADRLQYLLSNVNAILFLTKLSNFGTNFAATRVKPKSLVKIEWHEPIDMFRSSATSLKVIRRLTNTIFSASSMFSSVSSAKCIWKLFLNKYLTRLC